jgi:NAD(P)-dependent dehydrogenase (short-subunit alcohol dehydrogenase family)
VIVGDEIRVESSADEAGFRIMLGDAIMVVARMLQGVGTLPVVVDSPTLNLSDIPDKAVARTIGEIEMPLESRLLAESFPAAGAVIGVEALKGLAAISTLVGMEYPGLHGMLSEFSVALDRSQTAGSLIFQVQKYDAHFSRVEIGICGLNVTGTVAAFVGREGAREVADDDIRSLVAPTEFAGHRPLIIGASGGLGTVTARILAAGGARPTLTWNRSIDSANSVARSVSRIGGESDLLQLDVCRLGASLDELAAKGWTGEQAYYFATPRIFRRRVRPYQSEDLREFLEVFVDAFYDFTCGLMKIRPCCRVTVFYPSSVAVGNPTDELFEYSIAKFASERLCARLQRRYKSLRIVVAQLPRIETRQTLSYMQVKTTPAHVIMLPIIRDVQGTAAA